MIFIDRVSPVNRDLCPLFLFFFLLSLCGNHSSQPSVNYYLTICAWQINDRNLRLKQSSTTSIVSIISIINIVSIASTRLENGEFIHADAVFVDMIDLKCGNQVCNVTLSATQLYFIFVRVVFVCDVVVCRLHRSRCQLRVTAVLHTPLQPTTL